MLGKSKDPICPLLGKPCVEHGCRFWIMVQGHNANTGQDVSEWDCAVAWLPILLIENSQQQRSTGAAVESFRNQMVRGQNDSNRILVEMARAAVTSHLLETKQ